MFKGIAFIGADSEKALRFALAAGLQNKLWYAVDLLYENQGTENSGWVTDETLRAVGNAIPGLDVDKALADMSSPKVDAQINAIADEAEKLDVNATPTFAAAQRGEPLETFEVSDFSADAMHPKLDELLSR
jgi:protein-disulfide isomerase